MRVEIADTEKNTTTYFIVALITVIKRFILQAPGCVFPTLLTIERGSLATDK
jgi:hypothetical protein